MVALKKQKRQPVSFIQLSQARSQTKHNRMLKYGIVYWIHSLKCLQSCLSLVKLRTCSF